VMACVEIASAHANLVKAEPAPESALATAPTQLTLQFDSALARTGNAVALYHSDRSAVGLEPPRVVLGKAPELQVMLPSLPPDTYTVGWTSVSGEDGHSLSQFYSFVVGEVPKASPAPSPVQLQAGDTRVTLRASRGNVGPNTFDFAVRDSGGKPVASLQRVIVRYSPVGLDLGQNEVIAPATGGDGRTPSFTLGLAGQWRLQIVVRRADADDVTATTQLTLAPSTPATPTAAAAARPTESARPGPTRTGVAALAPTADPTTEPTITALASVSSPPIASGASATDTPASTANSTPGGPTPPVVALVAALAVLAAGGVVVLTRRR
jgi:methionine-rich copper-binding protein CopC